MWKRVLFVFIGVWIFNFPKGHCENTVYRKTQKVDFDAVDVDGQVRSPDGAFLNQKRAVKFLPLYKVKKSFNKNIRETMEYLR